MNITEDDLTRAIKALGKRHDEVAKAECELVQMLNAELTTADETLEQALIDTIDGHALRRARVVTLIEKLASRVGRLPLTPAAPPVGQVPPKPEPPPLPDTLPQILRELQRTRSA